VLAGKSRKLWVGAMFERALAVLCFGLLLSACAESDGLRNNLGVPPERTEARDPRKQTLASKVLGAIALEARYGPKARSGAPKSAAIEEVPSMRLRVRRTVLWRKRHKKCVQQLATSSPDRRPILTPRIASRRNVTVAVVLRALMDCKAHRDLPAVAGRKEGAARPQSCHRRRPIFGPRPRQ
jgi:hypothetical protein